MTPNCFVGLPVDPTGWYERRVSRPPPRTRRFPAADLHLTVAFFGPVPLERAVQAWRQVVAEAELGGPLEVRLGVVAPMGNPRRPSALSVLLADGRDEVIALLRRLRDPLLDAAGARPETRPPLPHVTIARPQRLASDEDRRRAIAWARSVDLQEVTLRLDRIALYTWAEDRRERLFRVVMERPLSRPLQLA